MSLDGGVAREVCKHPFKFPAALESNDMIGAEEVDHLDLELDAHPAMDKPGGVDQGYASTVFQGPLSEAFCRGECLDEVATGRGRTDKP